MALSTGAIIGLTVGIIFACIIVAIGFFICRMVYRAEHGHQRKRKPSVDSHGRQKMRSDNSASTIASNNTDFFVNKQEFNDMMANLEDTWQGQPQPQTSIDYNMDGNVDVVNGAAIYSNPVFDEYRGLAFDAAVTIQSWYRACRTRTELAKKGVGARIDGRRPSVASQRLVQMNVFQVRAYGLLPTGGHDNTDMATLLKLLETMRKKNSKKKKNDQTSRCLRLWVTVKGVKVMSHTEWEIRHNISLRHIYSHSLAPFNENVFGMIFRRKGITYCFAVICDGSDATSIMENLRDAYLLVPASQSSDGDRNDARRQSTMLSSPSSGEPEFLSPFGSPFGGSPRVSSSNIQAHYIPANEESMPHSVSSYGLRDRAAYTIQRWFRSSRIRTAFKKSTRRQSRPRSQTIELLPALQLYSAMFCAVSPVTREGATDRETLNLMTENSLETVKHVTNARLTVGVSCKGLTVLSRNTQKIIYKVPLRQTVAYAVSPESPDVLSLLYRSKPGLSSLIMKCSEAQQIAKALNEAELSSTMRQLEAAKANLPQNASSRELLESASTLMANYSEHDPAGIRGSSSISPPKPQTVTASLEADSLPPAQFASRRGHSKKASAHSLTNVISDSSMTSEAFAAAANSLLDSTLEQTQQFMEGSGEMSRSESREMRQQAEQIMTKSTLELLDEVKQQSRRPDTADGDAGAPKATPLPGAEPALSKQASSEITNVDLKSTIQGLLQL